MDMENLFYKRLENEYNKLLGDIYDMDTDMKVNNAGYISVLTEIYDYLITDKPIRMDTGLEHYIKMDKPLETIVSIYMDNMPPIYDRVNPTIWQIAEEKIYDFRNEHRYSTELKWELHMNIDRYKDEFPESIDKETWDTMLVCINDTDYQFNEDDAKFLLQFREPLAVITDFMKQIKGDDWNKRFAEAIKQLYQKDIFTLPYELDKEYIMQDSYDRHVAIEGIGRLLKHANPDITEKWLDMMREAAARIPAIEERKDNPYQYFLENLIVIKTRYGIAMAESIHNLKEQYRDLTEDDMLPAAEYLSRGGDIDKIGVLLDTDELAKYNPNHIQKKGGIDLC